MVVVVGRFVVGLPGGARGVVVGGLALGLLGRFALGIACDAVH